MTRRILALLPVALFLLIANHSLAAACPPDTLWVLDDTWQIGEGGRFVTQDSAAAIAPGNNSVQRTQEASYQLNRGTLSVRAWDYAFTFGSPPTFARVAAHDSFTVLGPEGAGAITFTARLTVRSHCAGAYSYTCFDLQPCWFPDGHASAGIREGESNAMSIEHTQTGGYEDILDVSITRARGDAFELTLSALALASGIMDHQVDMSSARYADVTATLSFPDLPSGWSVVSCQGYQAGEIVPVSRTTWGRIKTAYR